MEEIEVAYVAFLEVRIWEWYVAVLEKALWNNWYWICQGKLP